MLAYRFGAGTLAELPSLCEEIGVARPLLVATERGARSVGELPVVGVFAGVRPHVPVETVHEAAGMVGELEVDGIVAVGGGSTIDTAKAVVGELADAGVRPPRVIAVPTTYAGAEHTPFYGVLLAPGRKGGGSNDAARPVAAIYDPELTLGLSLPDTVGTSMNALAHCAEAYYHPKATRRAMRHADTGATAISYALPLVVASPTGLYGRSRLLEGAMRAAEALGASGLCLAHAMAQAVGGRYGIPQGAANAVCLPGALRFNAEAVPEAIERFAAALGVEDAPARCAELAALGGFERLRDLGVPESDLVGLAESAAARAGTKANPRAATAAEIAELFAAVW
ncbi:MAG: iron-containing alcohol dehydrogenase [Gaiellales bacterium]